MQWLVGMEGARNDHSVGLNGLNTKCLSGGEQRKAIASIALVCVEDRRERAPYFPILDPHLVACVDPAVRWSDACILEPVPLPVWEEEDWKDILCRWCAGVAEILQPLLLIARKICEGLVLARRAQAGHNVLTNVNFTWIREPRRCSQATFWAPRSVALFQQLRPLVFAARSTFLRGSLTAQEIFVGKRHEVPRRAPQMGTKHVVSMLCGMESGARSGKSANLKLE
mmetsp:Transcript_14419/g.46309  ORF Transcript_14419/g.46309 Transcript_14419/m.46309 type:complete len:226 (+) Transcript_14419:224-901(+)